MTNDQKTNIRYQICRQQRNDIFSTGIFHFIDTENVDFIVPQKSLSNQYILNYRFFTLKINRPFHFYLENVFWNYWIFGALFFELDIIFKDSLISFEYMSILSLLILSKYWNLRFK